MAADLCGAIPPGGHPLPVRSGRWNAAIPIARLRLKANIAPMAALPQPHLKALPRPSRGHKTPPSVGQLTVMFCDLVGSTVPSAKLDPEDRRGIIAIHHHCCTEWVERNGRFVPNCMGDDAGTPAAVPGWPLL